MAPKVFYDDGSAFSVAIVFQRSACVYVVYRAIMQATDLLCGPIQDEKRSAKILNEVRGKVTSINELGNLLALLRQLLRERIVLCYKGTRFAGRTASLRDP